MRFGRQRPAADVVVLALLLLGFSTLGLAIFYLRESLLGALLPLTFIAGMIAGLRAEVREVEIRPELERLIIRTFFRGYGIPRAHIKNVSITPRGVAIDVINGARYFINPPGVDPADLHRALTNWLG